MISNNLKVLRAYLFGIILSLFLTFPLGWMFGLSPHVFSTITALLSFALVYRVTWNFGRQDTEINDVSILKLLINISAFTLLSLVFFIFHIACGNSVPTLIDQISMIWYYPFTGFYSSFPAVTVALVAVVTVALSITSYIMGTKNISLLEKAGIKNKFQMLLKKKK